MQVRRHTLDVVKDRVCRCAATLDRKPSIAGNWGIPRTIARRLAKNLISAHARAHYPPGTCSPPRSQSPSSQLPSGRGYESGVRRAVRRRGAYSGGGERFRPSRAACHNWDRRRPDQFAGCVMGDSSRARIRLRSLLSAPVADVQTGRSLAFPRRSRGTRR
jgi:hypothetical protein